MEDLIEKNNQIKNEVNKILNEVVSQVEQSEMLHSKVGEAINTGFDIGIRAICPDYLESQVINLKDNFINNGLKEGINKSIEDAVDYGKSVLGILTGKFESISQAQNAIKSGGVIDNVSDLIDDIVDNLKKSDVIDKKLASTIKKEKNTIIKNVENNIENTFSEQINNVEKLDKYINNWKEDYKNQDFNSMKKEYKKMEKVVESLIPIENIINEFNTIKNLLFPPSNNSGTQDTTQDFVNIESIHENMIINKSGIAIMMIGLEAISRELMTEKEQVIQATKIIAELNGETEPYRLIKVQGAVDISGITNGLLSLKKTASEKRKLFINDEVQYLDKIATENSSFTPQFYVTIWDKNVEHLQQRAKEMTEKYRKAGVNAKLLNLKEIVYVLTLYTDPVAALAEQDVDNIVEAVKAPVMYFSDNNWEEMWKW